ncbi:MULTISPECIES: pyrroloquinoline quinone precursor peptide PqqA [Streptomyces]|uniref:pyrroloquinoline quinone precursor peptide PqqA n=1 Tax=Streptomyces TaxID=1883 RepID=UPI00292E1B5C|nr:pyrroloquinoline quinone precursor peptide PqqA [Streptomyces sp. NEAU-HV9]
MPNEAMEATSGPEREARTEAAPRTAEAAWERPDYAVVDTALEVTAYSLATR